MHNQMASNIPPPARLRRSQAAALPTGPHDPEVIMTQEHLMEYYIYHTNTAANAAPTAAANAATPTAAPTTTKQL